MLLTDIVLIIALLGFIGAGTKDGFVHTLGRLIGAVVGFLFAKAWFLSLASIFGLILPLSWARVVAFLLIFLFINRLVGMLFKLVDGAFSILSILPFLKSINALLGGILGFVEGVVLLGGAIYLILTFSLEPHLVQWLSLSSVAHWIRWTFQLVLGFLL